jgi:hypothetical protein
VVSEANDANVLLGHQGHVSWFDDEVLILADLRPDPCRAVIVGVNPALHSVTLGHYHQGANGRTALTKLRGAGLLPEPQGEGPTTRRSPQASASRTSSSGRAEPPRT